MKKKLSAFAIIAITIIAFATCKKPVPELALYVPKDASFVLTIHPKSILDKIATSGMSIDSLAHLFNDEKDKYALKWDDIKNSGIDLDQPIYVFVKANSSIQLGKSTSTGIIAKVKDAAKLEAFLKKEKVGADVMQGKEYHYIQLNDKTTGGWTDKVFILSSVVGGDNSKGNISTGEGMASQVQLNTIFSQDESASIAAAEGFSDMLKKNGDITYYSNSSANLNSVMVPGLSKAGTLLEGTYGEGVINFENGKIAATAESHYGKALADILEKYPSKSIDRSMVANYPDSISGFMVMAFNPKILTDIFKYMGLDAMADGFISNMGFTTSDIMNAFSGDISAVFSKPANSDIRSTRYILNLRIGDKAAFEKVMDGLVKKGLLSKNGNTYQLGRDGGHGFVIKTTGDALLIGASDELINAYETGNTKTSLPADIEKALNGKSLVLYIDINSLFSKSFSADTTHSTKALAKSTFKDFLMATDKSEGKVVKGEFTLDMVNQNENSLASLAKFLAAAHNNEMRKKQETPPIFMDSIPGTVNEPGKDSQ